MEFRFGTSDYDRDGFIEARSLAEAIELFKIKVLFPEDYVAKRFIAERDWSSLRDRYSVRLKPDVNALIPVDQKVFPLDEEGKRKSGWRWERVAELPLSECVDVTYVSSPVRGLLDAPENQDHAQEPSSTDVALRTSPKQLAGASKAELRALQMEIENRQLEVERQRRELESAMSALKGELAFKMKMLRFVEAYLGKSDEVVQIRDGAPAPDGTPLCVFQQLLYMDEEVGIWKDGGLDFNSKEEWDKWITENYEKFAYRPLSVVAWRVRRNAKSYGLPGWADIMANEDNFLIYLLIRNGDRLYRVWTSAPVEDRLFPTKDEYEKISTRDDKEAKKRHEHYLFGLVAIQGLIERTDVLGTHLRGKVNLPLNQLGGMIDLVRDAEQGHWLTDGHPSWHEFMASNQATIEQGSRIILMEAYVFGSDDKWRTPHSVSHAPSLQELYTVKETWEKKWGNSSMRYIKILYLPNDLIWGESYSLHERQRRISYTAYTHEALNFDALTLADIDFYIHCRLERQHYLKLLPVLFYARGIKEEEEKQEEPFVQLVASRLGWGEMRWEQIRQNVIWWKLKNKWKRNIMTDDAKALRMVEAKCRRDDNQREEKSAESES